MAGAQPRERFISTVRTYDFRAVTADEFDLVAKWRRNPHVRKWWGDDELLDQAALAHPLVRRWIVSLHDRPFAYIQDYAVQGWEFDHYFAHLPNGSRGIDQFVGERDMLGIGHGSAFIKQHVETLFEDGVPVVATDPDPSNVVAVSVYKRIGFQKFGDVTESDWGPILPMKIERKG